VAAFSPTLPSWQRFEVIEWVRQSTTEPFGRSVAFDCEWLVMCSQSASGVPP